MTRTPSSWWRGLTADELSVLIDRYATYEPVLDAEIESGGMRVSAKVHADNGDYAVADAVILKALRAPREHALVISAGSGKESDLLDGLLRVAAAAAQHEHAHMHDERTTSTRMLKRLRVPTAT